ARFGGLQPGVKLPSPDEVNQAAKAGLLSRADKSHIDTLIAEGMRRNEQDKEQKDISKDPLYKRGLASVRERLPSSDRLDLDAETRMIVGNALRDFDLAMRSGKYKMNDADRVADSIVQTALAQMGKADAGLRIRLLPGITSPEDVGQAVRDKRMTPDQARQQLQILDQLERSKKTRPTPGAAGAPKPQTEAERNKAAMGLGIWP